MKAIHLKKYGNPNEVMVFKDLNIPRPDPNEVLVKIHSAALNPIDYKIARGDLRLILPLKLPFTTGFDFSGTIAAVGTEVTKYEVGNKVFGRLPLHKGGAFAEYTCIDHSLIAQMPSISFDQAASFPLVALTGFQALHNRTKTGMKILIHAGSGGVGTFTIQYAKNILNLEVTAVTSSKNIEFLKNLGADKVIAYDKKSYLKNNTKYDVVFDTMGGSHTINSFKVLKKGGIVVSIGGPPDINFVWQLKTNMFHKLLLFPILTLSSLPIYLIALLKNASYRRFLTESNGQHLSEIKEFINEGAIVPVIDKIFAFENFFEGMDYIMKGRTKGKIVLKIQN